MILSLAGFRPRLSLDSLSVVNRMFEHTTLWDSQAHSFRDFARTPLAGGYQPQTCRVRPLSDGVD